MSRLMGEIQKKKCQHLGTNGNGKSHKNQEGKKTYFCDNGTGMS